MRIRHDIIWLVLLASTLIANPDHATADPGCVDYVGLPSTSFDTDGSANGVDVIGTVVLIADREAGLQLFRNVRGEDPYWLGSYPTQGPACDVAASGDQAYVVEPENGLLVISIDDPTEPLLIASLEIQGAAYRIRLVGTIAYIAAHTGGLVLVDISIPSSPVVIGHVDTPGYAVDLAVQGHLVYVADFNDGLQIIDASVPSSPVIIGSVDTSGSAYGVAVAGNVGYVADHIGGVKIIDISTPSSPSIAGDVSMDGSQAYDVWVEDDILLVGLGGGVRYFDCSEPFDPVDISQFSVSGYVRAISVVGNRAYLAASAVGLVVTSAFPPVLATIETLGRATSVAVLEPYVVVTQQDEGLRAADLEIFDLSQFASPTSIGTLELPGSNARGVGIHDDIAVVAAGTQGMYVVDLSAPEHPAHVGTLPGDSTVLDIVFNGEFAFFAGNPSLGIVDLSAPSAPELVGEWDIQSGNCLAFREPYVFLVTYDQLRVINVANAMNPVEVANLDLPRGSSYEYFHDIAINGGVAYIVGSYGSLISVSINFPTSPVLLSNIAGHDGSYGVTAADGAVYVSAWSGVFVYDASDPSLLQELGSVPAHDGLWNPVVHDGRVYCANGDWGVQVLATQCETTSDVGDPMPPLHSIVKAYPNPFNPTITIEFENRESGMVILDIFDVAGRKVRELVSTVLPSGSHEVIWWGCDDAGRRLGSGVYILRMTSTTGITTRKIAMIQ